MQISFNLTDSSSNIQRQILLLLREEVDKIFTKSIRNIQSNIRSLIKEALISEPEYSSLISGKLKYEFGIPISQQVNNIIDLWISKIVVEYRQPQVRTSTITGGFTLSAIQSDYGDVLASDSAIVIDSISGAVLPWLEWLLLYGGKIIVRNYKVKFGPNPRSRTGMALMIESEGDNWRVPPEFAGTAANNWVTRALDKIDEKILDIIQSEIEKNI